MCDVCDMTLLAPRCHAASKPRSTPHAARGGSAGNITSLHNSLRLFTTQPDWLGSNFD